MCNITYCDCSLLTCLRKSGALTIMCWKSSSDRRPSLSRSASSITFSHTILTSSSVSSLRVSLFSVFSRSDLQIKSSLLKSVKRKKNNRKVVKMNSCFSNVSADFPSDWVLLVSDQRVMANLTVVLEYFDLTLDSWSIYGWTVTQRLTDTFFSRIFCRFCLYCSLIEEMKHIINIIPLIHSTPTVLSGSSVLFSSLQPCWNTFSFPSHESKLINHFSWQMVMNVIY